jgi:S-adenosylhomocysteine hydrolase
MHAITLADVLLHAGIDTVFAGFGACMRGVCTHTKAQHVSFIGILITALIILTAAIVQVALVG